MIDQRTKVGLAVIVAFVLVVSFFALWLALFAAGLIILGVL